VLNVKEFLPEEQPVMATPPFVKIIKVLQNGIKEGEIKALDGQRAYCHFFGIAKRVETIDYACNLRFVNHRPSHITLLT
jgi:hypothetical protein